MFICAWIHHVSSNECLTEWPVFLYINSMRFTLYKSFAFNNSVTYMKLDFQTRQFNEEVYVIWHI